MRQMTFPIRLKILASFLLITVLLGTAGVIAYVYMQKVDRSYSDLVNRRAAVLLNAKEMQVQATQINSSARDYLLSRDSAAMDKLDAAINELKGAMEKASAMVQSEQNKRLLQEMKQNLQNLEQVKTEFVQMVQDSPEQSLSFASDNLFPLSREIRDESDQLASYQQTQMEEASRENTKTVRNALSFVIVALIVATAAAVAMALFMADRLSKPLVRMAAAARLIADGDLTHDISVLRRRDELGSMSAAFQQMAANLRSLIRTVSHSAEAVAASSEELTASAEQSTQAAQQIAQVTQDIAKGADNQANGAEANSRAVEELASAIQRLASSAAVMHESSLQAAERAERGSQLMRRVSSHMETIQQASNESAGLMEILEGRLSEIGNIVDMMGQIANQTQLLSLNASIEAARAGEAGRGFAVVAEEVKKLAAQSEQSAQTVAEQLEDISLRSSRVAEAMRSGAREVDNGMKAVRDAEQAFAEILESVHLVSKEVEEASAVSEQMAASSQQISASMEEAVAIAEETSAGAQEVSAATEEQLASMEEISSSSAELSRTAQELHDIISRFRV
jgi:methyl-accepting chemotaxis protein